MAFLEILTRHYVKRPAMLAANQASLETLTSDDWQQTLIVDEAGYGVKGANRALSEMGDRLGGTLIWVLDDDDMCVYHSLVEELKRIWELWSPDVIMTRMDHGPLGILPSDKFWGKHIVRGGVGSSAFFVRRELWQRYGHYWNVERMGDYSFINALWQLGYDFFWYDIVASRVQAIGHGRTEEEMEAAPWPL